MNFFKNIFNKTKVTSEQINASKFSEDAIKFIDKITDESLEKRESYTIKLSNLENYKSLKIEKEDFKKEVIFLLIHYKNKNVSASFSDTYFINEFYSKLLSLLIRSSDIEFNDDEILKLSKELSAKKKGYFIIREWPIMSYLSRIENKVKNNGLNPKLKSSLKNIKKLIPTSGYIYADDKKVLSKIRLIEEGPTDFSVNKGDELGKKIIETTAFLKEDKQNKFIELLKHFSKGIEKSKPTNVWLKESSKKISGLNNPDFLVSSFISWMETYMELIKEIHKKKPNQFYLVSEKNLQLLRSSVWVSPLINDVNLNQVIEELGLWCFKKLPGHGALSAKLGNSCIYAFSKLPYQNGVARLTKFRMKIKYPSVQSLITKAIVRVAEAEDKTMDEIEELAIKDYNFNDNYELIKEFGDSKGVFKIIDSSSTTLTWINSSGKRIKSVPKYVKDNFPDELKNFKKLVKEIQSNLSVQRNRIEKIYLAKRTWAFNDWKELYVENKLLSFFAEKLIWNFTDNQKTITAVPTKDKFLSINGEEIFNFKESTVELWHPVEANAKDVLRWRNWFIENEIKQPFKQAHREVYIVTDAEKNTNSYSNRFAAHIIRQHVFNALCRERGWNYQLQGQWDSYNTPSIYIPAWKFKAEFWVDTEGVYDLANEMGVLNYLQTDQVRFYDEESQVNMVDVPPILFSELMRDVDLFVGVTSIGADPNWTDGGEERFHGYWNNFSFGELATSGKERKLLLENLIPKLKIKDQCSFEGNFLVVKGSIRIYKIHMGSGNILMKPNDQYLCIVADRKKDTNVFLPFEGDSTLSIILSKAFMLANDEKIKDKTIVNQIEKR